MAMTTYRLASVSMFHIPSVLKWGVNGFKFQEDRANIAKIFVEAYRLPQEVVENLLSEKIPFVVDGEDVVFTA